MDLAVSIVVKVQLARRLFVILVRRQFLDYFLFVRHGFHICAWYIYRILMQFVPLIFINLRPWRMYYLDLWRILRTCWAHLLLASCPIFRLRAVPAAVVHKVRARGRVVVASVVVKLLGLYRLFILLSIAISLRRVLEGRAFLPFILAVLVAHQVDLRRRCLRGEPSTSRWLRRIMSPF
jgi:hypothetical protein